MTTENLYLEGEEQFGPISSFLFGIGSVFLNRYYNLIIEDVGSREFDRLLDVGCGPGSLLAKLARRYQERSFYGIDPSPHMLRRANKYLMRKGFGNNIELKLGSSRAIPFDIKFDAIISSFSYHHWVDRDASLVSLLSHLSEHGFISIYEYDNSERRISSSHGVSEDEWKAIEIDGVQKTIAHKKGMIILTLVK